MSFPALLTRPGPNGFGFGSTAERVTAGLDLSGKHILLTGANSGLGAETLRVLVKRGATVYATSRTQARARATCQPYGELAVPLVCELTDPASIRACVADVKSRGVKLDAVIGNAGVMAVPQRETVHGIERQFFTNHIGHFMLVAGLLDTLADNGRVVMVSSSAHRRPPPGGIQFGALDGYGWYAPWLAYGQSKLANLLFAKALAKRFAGTKRVSIAVHPGVIRTNLVRHMAWWVVPVMRVIDWFVFKSLGEGASTQVYAAVHPEAVRLNGQFLVNCNVAQPTVHARDEEMAERLWQVSETIVAALD
ncbi:SDR family NAD(P)-dependent oxidoreductase [bacterium]|nr:SDR family NAD(P)-dependent oxidoreductase [bacterium]